MYNITPVITKEYIIDHLDQVQILEYYLGIKVQEKKVRSPLRQDNNPSCSFKANGNGVIYFKDWAQGFTGDWIKIIQYKYGLTYQQALEKCAEDFNLVKGNNSIQAIARKEEKIKIEIKESNIEIKLRKWDVYDKNYWFQYGIHRKTLNLYNIYPCEIVFYNKKVIYTRTKNDLAYAYRFGTGKYKIYMPQRNAFKWLSNFTSWQGLNQLSDSLHRLLIITKSMKDVMCLKQFNIDACAPASEVIEPDEEIMLDLLDRFYKVVSLMDFDLTGIKMANRLYKKYKIRPLFLNNGRFGTYDYGAKDISDFYQLNGYKKTKGLINNGLITLINKYEYNKNYPR
jgi:hypothetical protein